MDGYRAGRAGWHFPFSGVFVEFFPFNFDGGMGGRQLHARTHEAGSDFFYVFSLGGIVRLLELCDGAGMIIGIGDGAECDGCSVLFVPVVCVLDEASGGAESDYEQAGGKWVKGAGVADFRRFCK